MTREPNKKKTTNDKRQAKPITAAKMLWAVSEKHTSGNRKGAVYKNDK